MDPQARPPEASVGSAHIPPPGFSGHSAQKPKPPPPSFLISLSLDSGSRSADANSQSRSFQLVPCDEVGSPYQPPGLLELRLDQGVRQPPSRACRGGYDGAIPGGSVQPAPRSQLCAGGKLPGGVSEVHIPGPSLGLSLQGSPLFPVLGALLPLERVTRYVSSLF